MPFILNIHTKAKMRPPSKTSTQSAGSAGRKMPKMEILVTKSNKFSTPTYEGKCRPHGNVYWWKTGIYRVCREHAEEDAKRLANEILRQNSLPEEY